MKAQHLGRDYYLLFNRKGSKYIIEEDGELKISGGELGNPRQKKFHADLLNSEKKSTGKTIDVLSEENPGELGVEISFPSQKRVIVKLDEKAYAHLEIYNELVVGIPHSDEILRIKYNVFEN